MNAETKDLAEMPEGQAMVATNPMEMIAAALDKGMPPEVISQFMDLQDRWQANLAKVAFEHAMAKFQSLCPVIPKTEKGHNSKYAPYDTIMATIRPILDECGLSIRFNRGDIEAGQITVKCRVAHVDGHSEESQFTCPVDPKMSANDSQKVASANSYARRYAVTNALNLATGGDDDGRTGGGSPKVDETEVIKIREWIEALGRDEAKFCNWLKCSSLEMMRPEQLGRAKLELKKIEDRK